MRAMFSAFRTHRRPRTCGSHRAARAARLRRGDALCVQHHQPIAVPAAKQAGVLRQRRDDVINELGFAAGIRLLLVRDIHAVTADQPVPSAQRLPCSRTLDPRSTHVAASRFSRGRAETRGHSRAENLQREGHTHRLTARSAACACPLRSGRRPIDGGGCPPSHWRPRIAVASDRPRIRWGS